MEDIRIDSLISQSGFCARRKVADFLANNHVTVDGKQIVESGKRIDAGAQVMVNGEPLVKDRDLLYIALNKPSGYICASSDPQGRLLALDLIPQARESRLYNVGRLDFESCGLIFFTNDGQWAKRITHPSSQIEKEYYIETSRPFSIHNLNKFKEGIEIEGEHYQLKDYHLDQDLATNHLTSVNLILTEGKNREIRTVFSYFNAPVKYLKRVRIGSVILSGLTEGKSRVLSKSEIDFI